MDNALFIINSAPFSLTEKEKRRLLKYAPMFDIHVEFPAEGVLRVFNDTNKANVKFEDLPLEIGYCRLVMEVSSKTARWLYFQPKEHCRETLLNHTDAKIERTAELYTAWKAKGFSD